VADSHAPQRDLRGSDAGAFLPATAADVHDARLKALQRARARCFSPLWLSHKNMMKDAFLRRCLPSYRRAPCSLRHAEITLILICLLLPSCDVTRHSLFPRDAAHDEAFAPPLYVLKTPSVCRAPRISLWRYARGYQCPACLCARFFFFISTLPNRRCRLHCLCAQRYAVCARIFCASSTRGAYKIRACARYRCVNRQSCAHLAFVGALMREPARMIRLPRVANMCHTSSDASGVVY